MGSESDEGQALEGLSQERSGDAGEQTPRRRRPPPRQPPAVVSMRLRSTATGRRWVADRVRPGLVGPEGADAPACPAPGAPPLGANGKSPARTAAQRAGRRVNRVVADGALTDGRRYQGPGRCAGPRGSRSATLRASHHGRGRPGGIRAGPQRSSGPRTRLGGLTSRAVVPSCCSPSSGTAASSCWRRGSNVPRAVHAATRCVLQRQHGEGGGPVPADRRQEGPLAEAPELAAQQGERAHYGIRAR